MYSQYVLSLLPRRKVAGMRRLSPSIVEVKEGLPLNINNPTGPVQVSNLPINMFFSPGVTTPIGGCILQPSSGL